MSRTAAILPWDAPEEVPKLSPVTASAAYLQHLRCAWDARIAAGDPALALDRHELPKLTLVPPPLTDDEVLARGLAAAGLRSTRRAR